MSATAAARFQLSKRKPRLMFSPLVEFEESQCRCLPSLPRPAPWNSGHIGDEKYLASLMESWSVFWIHCSEKYYRFDSDRSVDLALCPILFPDNNSLFISPSIPREITVTDAQSDFVSYVMQQLLHSLRIRKADMDIFHQHCCTLSEYSNQVSAVTIAGLDCYTASRLLEHTALEPRSTICISHSKHQR